MAVLEFVGLRMKLVWILLIDVKCCGLMDGCWLLRLCLMRSLV